MHRRRFLGVVEIVDQMDAMETGDADEFPGQLLHQVCLSVSFSSLAFGLGERIFFSCLFIGCFVG